MNQSIVDKGNMEDIFPLFFSVISALFLDQVLGSFEKKQLSYFGCYPEDGNCLFQLLLIDKCWSLEPEGNLEETDENLSLKSENTVLEENDNSWALFISSFWNKVSFGVSEAKSTEGHQTSDVFPDVFRSFLL